MNAVYVRVGEARLSADIIPDNMRNITRAFYFFNTKYLQA